MLIEKNIRDDIALLTLNRPERRNALGTAMMTELAGHLVNVTKDSTIRAIVLSGSDDAFSAGSDLKELAELDTAGMAEHEAGTAAVVRKLMTCPLPVIAAVEGYALGGGCALAMACDIVVASESARMAMPEVANGWIPPWGLMAIRRRCTDIQARQFIWGAEACDVQELVAKGLVDKACAPGTAVDTALSIADKLAQLPPASVASTKRFFADAAQAESDDARSSQMFKENGITEAAQVTFEKFSRKGIAK